MKSAFISFLFSFFGAILGLWSYHHIDFETVPHARANSPTNIEVKDLRLVDSEGRLRAQLATTANGGVALFFFDSNGKNRMNFGIYPKAEGDFPFLVLNDEKNQAAGLFRLVENNRPYLILKADGMDKSIFGLAKSGDSFLNYTIEGRSKSLVLSK